MTLLISCDCYKGECKLHNALIVNPISHAPWRHFATWVGLTGKKEREMEKEPVSHAGQGLTHFHVTCEKQQEPLMAVMWLEGNR